MKILTWNILASEWIDETYNEVKNADVLNNKNRFNRIFQYIRTQDASLILLQEVMPYEYKRLKILLQDNYAITPLCRINWDKYKNNSGNVTLFKRTEFDDTYMNHVRLEFGIQTKCLYKNKTCLIYNIHFDVSIRNRYAQLKSIMHVLLETETCIIGGDFNHQYIKNTKFYKISDYTIHNTTCMTYVIGRKSIIDNILTKGFKIYDTLTCPEYHNDLEKILMKYGSDHIPITLNII